MKTCSRCKKRKKDSKFRMRKEKRRGGCSYLNNICKKCEGEVSNQNYFAHKDDPEWMEKWRQKSMEYSRAHREQVNQRQKLKRATAAYKKMKLEYRKKNKEKIARQEVITKRRYHEKNRDGLTDKYIVARMGLTIKDLPLIKETMPELLELKRAQIKLTREVKKHGSSTKKGITYGK